MYSVAMIESLLSSKKIKYQLVVRLNTLYGPDCYLVKNNNEFTLFIPYNVLVLNDKNMEFTKALAYCVDEHSTIIVKGGSGLKNINNMFKGITVRRIDMLDFRPECLELAQFAFCNCTCYDYATITTQSLARVRDISGMFQNAKICTLNIIGKELVSKESDDSDVLTSMHAFIQGKPVKIAATDLFKSHKIGTLYTSDKTLKKLWTDNKN